MFTNSKLFQDIRKSRWTGTIVRNLGWVFIEKLWVLGVGVVVALWLARILGPEQYGVLALAFAIPTIIAPIADLGFFQSLTTVLVKRPAEHSEIMNTAFLTKALWGLFLSGVCYLILWLAFGLSWELNLIASASIFFRFYSVFEVYYESVMRQPVKSRIRIASFTVASFLRVLTAALGVGLWYVAAATILDTVLFGILLLLLLRKELRVFVHKVNLKILRELLILSYPALLSGFAMAVYMRVDHVIIGAFLKASDLGIYALATRFSECSLFLPPLIMTSIYPLMARMAASADDRLQGYSRLVMILTVGIAVSAAVVLALIAGPLVTLVFGDKYADSVPVIQVLAFSSVPLAYGQFFSRWLMLNGAQQYEPLLTALGAVANIALNLILIPHLGVMGAAWSAVIGYSASWLLMPFLFVRTRVLMVMLIRSRKLST